MKRSKFTDEQILAIVEEGACGVRAVSSAQHRDVAAPAATQRRQRESA
jgi:hypothetical protein